MVKDMLPALLVLLKHDFKPKHPRYLDCTVPSMFHIWHLPAHREDFLLDLTVWYFRLEISNFAWHPHNKMLTIWTSPPLHPLVPPLLPIYSRSFVSSICYTTSRMPHCGRGAYFPKWKTFRKTCGYELCPHGPWGKCGVAKRRFSVTFRISQNVDWGLHKYVKYF